MAQTALLTDAPGVHQSLGSDHSVLTPLHADLDHRHIILGKHLPRPDLVRVQVTPR